MYSEEDLLPLSALQHFIYCERQCALIHIEQLWDENLLTAEGRIMHERVHELGEESRGNVKSERGGASPLVKAGVNRKGGCGGISADFAAVAPNQGEDSRN